MKNTLAALCCSAALLAAPAWAQESEVKYQLEIEAPKELREMLRQGLQLARWHDDAQMTPGAAAAPGRRGGARGARRARRARLLLARASATSSIATARPWRGDRCTSSRARAPVVRSVELVFSGPAASDPEAAELIGATCGANGCCARACRSRRPAGTRPSATRCASSRRGATPAARVAASRARIDPETRTAPRSTRHARQRAAVPLRRGRGARQQALPRTRWSRT